MLPPGYTPSGGGLTARAFGESAKQANADRANALMNFVIVFVRLVFSRCVSEICGGPDFESEISPDDLIARRQFAGPLRINQFGARGTAVLDVFKIDSDI